MTFAVMQMYMDHQARKMADAIDEAIIWGDADGSFNTAWSTTVSHGRAWDGIVARCAGASINNGANANVPGSWVTLGDMLSYMGQHAGSRFSVSPTGANGTGFLVSWANYFDLMTEEDTTWGPTPIVTVDKYGPQASIVSGEAARMFGRPIFPMALMHQVEKANGEYQAALSAAADSAVAVNFGFSALGTRRGVEVRTSEHVAFLKDALTSLCLWRGHWLPLLAEGTSSVIFTNFWDGTA
jgi:hypothetical protein